MSTVKTNKVQIGQSGTADNNFTITTPATPDGTITIHRGNAGAEGAAMLKIDAAGRLLVPNQVAFNVASTVGVGNDAQQTYNTVYVNRGGHFSTTTSRFTAPVTGAYHFEWATIKGNGVAADVHRQRIRKNGVIFLSGRHLRLSEGSTYGDGSCSAIIELVAGDYVDIFVNHSVAGSFGSAEYTWFQGYLIG